MDHGCVINCLTTLVHSACNVVSANACAYYTTSQPCMLMENYHVSELEMTPDGSRYCGPVNHDTELRRHTVRIKPALGMYLSVAGSRMLNTVVLYISDDLVRTKYLPRY